MFARVVSYYKGHICTYSLVTKNFSLLWYTSVWSLFLLVFSFMFMIFAVCAQYLVVQSLLMFGILIGVFLSSFHLFNAKAKKYAKNKYNITPPKGFIWKDENFDDMQEKLLIEYLKKNNVYNENKIKLLIDLLNKKAERNKMPKYFASGIFLALFIPAWSQFMVAIYKQYTDAMIVTGIVFIFVFAFVSFLGISKDAFEFLGEMISRNSENELMKGLALLLENVLVRIDTEKE